MSARIILTLLAIIFVSQAISPASEKLLAKLGKIRSDALKTILSNPNMGCSLKQVQNFASCYLRNNLTPKEISDLINELYSPRILTTPIPLRTTTNTSGLV